MSGVTILGINAYHGDVSAALVHDGRLIAAVEEERFSRIKHTAGFPSHAIQSCLDAAGIQAREVDHVAISRNPRANLLHKAAFALRSRAIALATLQRLETCRRE
jgi:carbamoyltransferase